MKRTIRTDYYQNKKLVKSTRSKWANKAVANAVTHLQVRHYDATHCEVFDMHNGVLHAVLKMSIGSDKLEVLYKRPIVEGM